MTQTNDCYLNPDPFLAFEGWFQEAKDAQDLKPEAMTLSTVTPEGRPAGRIVLFKEMVDRGLVFYTNYESPKGAEIVHQPYCELLFYWKTLKKQIRISGNTQKADPAVSDRYFQTRKRGKQIGAWASPQGRIIPSREFLKNRFDEFTKQFEGKDIPRPAHWGGYRLVPDRFEFWEKRPDRLHDRFLYTKHNGEWLIQRMAP